MTNSQSFLKYIPNTFTTFIHINYVGNGLPILTKVCECEKKIVSFFCSLLVNGSAMSR